MFLSGNINKENKDKEQRWGYRGQVVAEKGRGVRERKANEYNKKTNKDSSKEQTGYNRKIWNKW